MRRFSVYLTVFLLCIPNFATSVNAAGKAVKGVCVFVSGTIGKGKYATIKCYKESSPGNYVIRKTVYERDDREAYRDLAKLAGLKLRCDLVKTGTYYRDDYLITNYSVKNCKRAK